MSENYAVLRVDLLSKVGIKGIAEALRQYQLAEGQNGGCEIIIGNLPRMQVALYPEEERLNILPLEGDLDNPQLKPIKQHLAGFLQYLASQETPPTSEEETRTQLFLIYRQKGQPLWLAP